jgi:hypothetical protein
MDMVPRSRYIKEELRRKTIKWTHMSSQFLSNFCFNTEYLTRWEVLCWFKDFIFHR